MAWRGARTSTRLSCRVSHSKCYQHSLPWPRRYRRRPRAFSPAPWPPIGEAATQHSRGAAGRSVESRMDPHPALSFPLHRRPSLRFHLPPRQVTPRTRGTVCHHRHHLRGIAITIAIIATIATTDNTATIATIASIATATTICEPPPAPES